MRDYPTEFYCDLAQYYGVMNPNDLPAHIVARLIMGLPSGSRLKLIATGIDPANIPPGQILLASLCDIVKQVPYALTGTTYNGPTFLGDIMGVEQPKPRKQEKGKPEASAIVFESPEDFNAARAKIMG